MWISLEIPKPKYPRSIFKQHLQMLLIDPNRYCYVGKTNRFRGILASITYDITFVNFRWLQEFSHLDNKQMINEINEIVYTFSK